MAVILGGLLASTGLVLSSFATSLEYLYLSLGVLTGQSSDMHVQKTLKSPSRTFDMDLFVVWSNKY